jgi:hypothetical protein
MSIERFPMRQRRFAVMLIFAAAAFPAGLRAQRSDMSLSPFMALPRTEGLGRAAGLAFTIAQNPDLALRFGGQVALKNTYAGSERVASSLPPWAAEIDMLGPISGRPFERAGARVAGTYAIIGVGAGASDTADTRVTRKNWSYGLGISLPFGSVIDVVGESRWRINKFVLPTAKQPKVKEYRLGLAFHLPSAAPTGITRRR